MSAKAKMKEYVSKMFSTKESTSSTDHLIASQISGLGAPTSAAPSLLLHSLPPRQSYRVYHPTTASVHTTTRYDRVPIGDSSASLGYAPGKHPNRWRTFLRTTLGRTASMADSGQLEQNLRQEFDKCTQIDEKHPTIQEDDYQGGESRLGPQVLAALSVSLGSMVVGFASAYTSPAGVSMVNNITAANYSMVENASTWEANVGFEVTEKDVSFVGGILPLAALVGGVVGGPLIDVLGRKTTILATAIPFIISWLFIGLAVNLPMILVGRGIGGFCVGLASLALPVYLGETVQPEVRGTLGLLPTAFGNTGILLAYCAGMFLNWWELALLGALVPIPFLILLSVIPETPAWYLTKDKSEEARAALQWLRGKGADVQVEFSEVKKSVEKNKQGGTSLSTLLAKQYLKPVAITIGLMFFQQFSGVNAVIFYTVQIFKDVGSTLDGNICTIIVGCVNFASTFLATTVIDRMGRKMLLYVSSVTMTITLGTLGTYMYIKENNIIDVSQFSYVPLLSLVLYIIGFSLGFGPIPWLMMGEILPSKIRGPAASVATAFNWACTSVITFTFADLIDGIGTAYTFWLFGIVCFVALFFVIFCVPETRGKTLEDIERKFAKQTTRRMSSIANLRPSPMSV